MKSLQNVLKEKVCENKIAKKCLALLLALSMTVGFVMPYEEVFESAVMSAFAAGRENEAENFMEEAYDQAPTDTAADFEDHITSVEVNGGNISTDNNIITATGNQQSIKAVLSYEYAAGTAPVDVNQRYIYYKLNGVKLNASVCGESAAANDSEWTIDGDSGNWSDVTKGVPAYYSISTDGMIVIKFTESYIKDKIQRIDGDRSLKGSITVEGYIERGATAKGDKIVSFGNQQLTVQFDDIIKEGSKTNMMSIKDGKPVVHYTIQIDNPGQNIEFKNYDFTDSLISAHPDRISGVSYTDGCITYNNGTIAFTDKAKDCNPIIIEYDYTPTEEEFRTGAALTNNVTIVNKSDDKDRADTSSEITLDPDYVKADITKRGTPSYESDTENTGYIDWTIEVSRQYGLSLNSYVVNDEAFEFFSDNTEAELVSVVDENGYAVNYTPDWTNGNLTINGDVDKVIITYKTHVDNNGTQLDGRTGVGVNNSATVTPKGDTNPDDSTDITITYSEDTDVTKSGENQTIGGYDKLNKPASEEKILEWTANITDFGGIQGGKTYTDTLTGDNQWFTQEQINKYMTLTSKQGVTLTKDVDYTVALSSDKKSFTITFKNEINNKEVKNLTISYQSTANTIGINFNSSGTFTNHGEYDNKSGYGEITVTRGDDPYIGKETFSFGADKVWVGISNHPEIHFQLQYRIDESTEWKDYENPQKCTAYPTWNNLPKVDTKGKTIYYRVIEKKYDGWDNAKGCEIYTNFLLTDYIVSYNYSGFDFEKGITADQYATLNGRLQVTNTYKYFDGTVSKSWANIPDDRSKFDVTFTLWEKVGDGEWTNTSLTQTLTDGQNTNTVSFENLSREENGETVYYKVVESADDNKLNDYTITYNNVAWAELTDDQCITAATPTMTVTNTYNKIGVKAVKKWVGDDNNSANSRPNDETGITVTLQKSTNGTNWIDVETFKLTSADNWTHLFENLPKTDGSGNTLYYKVVESAVDGYTTSYQANPIYCGNINSYINNYEITNTWDKVTVTPQKKWVGDDGKEGRPDKIEFKLQFKSGAGGTWTDASESTVDAIKSQQNITITVDKNSDTQTAENSWKSLPKEDGNGNTYYYRAVEAAVQSGYYETYDDNGLNQTGISTVTNTLNTISITPAKEWVGDDFDSSKRNDVELKLQWRYAGETEWKDTGTVPVSEKANVTISKTNVDTWTGTAWANLPKTYTENGERKLIEYHVIETSTNQDYTSQASAVLSVNGTATVINTYNYIKITADKMWVGDTDEDRHEKITFTLQQSTDNGNTWVDVNTQEITLEGLTTTSETFHDSVSNQEKTGYRMSNICSWDNLPKKSGDNDVIYKVVESPVSGYNTTYSGNISGNSGTITITNTKKGDYSKLALSPEPHKTQTKSFDELKATEITSITANDLKNITKKDAVINGETKSCYIFKWMAIFPKNEVVDYVDDLPENSVFYVEEQGSSYRPSVGNQWTEPWILYDTNIPHYYVYPYENDYSKVRFHFTNDDNTEAIDTQNIKCFVYYTATPVETVDTAVAAQGYYELNNTITRKDDTKGETATLVIGNKPSGPSDNNQVITKEYNTEDLDSDAKNARAKYTVYINPDAVKLSSENYLDVSDIFDITKYVTPSGQEYTGSNLLDATIQDIKVFDMNNLNANGKPTSISDFILFPAETREENEFISLGNDVYNAVRYGNNKDNITWLYIQFARDVAQGNEFVFEIPGTPNANVEFDDGYRGGLYGIGGVEVVALDEKFSPAGKARIKITLTADAKSGNDLNIGIINAVNGDYTLISAGLTQQVEKTVNTLKVPDEKYLKITYYYNLKVNANTPADNGETLTIGAKPPVGAQVYFKNEASLETSDGTKKDETDETNFVIQNAGATTSTGVLPSIEKINIGNEAENNLEATFKLARFNNGKWEYASDFGSSSTLVPAYDTAKSITETDKKVPAGAADLNIKGNKKISLENDTLYKLVEIVSPEGYIQTLYKEGISLNSDDMKDFVFYFMYAKNAETDISAIAESAGINKDSIMDIQSGNVIKAKNIELIDISVGKTWAQVPEGSTVSSTFKLYYSTKRSSTIPDKNDLTEVENSEKTIEFEINNGVMTQTTEAETLTWSGLPNGKDGKPIYYYVKETSYTINNKTYVLQDDGSYKCDNETGEYNGLYTGNAADTTCTIECTNTKGIYVQKEWLNSDNSLMNSAPVDSIQFKLYGKLTADGDWEEINLSNNNVLSEVNNWQQLIPSESLTGYVDFKVEEVKKDKDNNDLGVTLYGYKISYTKNLNGTSGVLTISNKNPNVTNINFIVNKEWGDGLDASKHTEKITVTLYRSETAWAGYTPTDAEKTASEVVESVTLSAEKGWSYTWENLANLQGNGQTYYYYAVENALNGYDASYSQSGSSSTKVVTITNTPKLVDGKLTVSKEWDKVNTPNQKEVTLELYRRKKALNTSEYRFNTNLKIACAGDSITEGTYGNTYNSKTQGSYPAELAKMLGITMSSNKEGSWLVNNGENNRLIDAMNANLTKFDFSGDQNSVSGIVCVIIGTNNIISTQNPDTPQAAFDKLKTYIESIQSGHTIFLASIPHVKEGSQFNGNVTTTNANIDSYNTLIQNYVNTQKTAGNNNLIFVDINNVITDNYICDDGIHPNNAGYTKIAETFYNAIGEKFGTKNNVDTSIQTNIDDIPADLTTNAYEKVCEVTLDGKVDASTTDVGNIEGTWQETKPWVCEWENLLPTTFKENDIDYQWIYYVKEVKPTGADWEVSYSHNGQPAKGQTAITVTNTGTDETPKAPVKVTKKWLADGQETDVHPDEITVQLYSSTSQNSGYTPVAGTEEKTLNAGNGWTAVWENLETGLYYKAVETAIAGWEQSSTTVQLREASTTDNPAEIVLTNTLEKGSLEIGKKWLEGTQPNADGVEVELYRVAVDKDGNPVSETPQTADVMALSSADNMYSLSRAKMAIARLSEQNAVQEISEDADEGIMPMSVNNNYVSLEINSNEYWCYAIPVDELKDKQITKVTVVLDKECSFYIDFHNSCSGAGSVTAYDHWANSIEVGGSNGTSYTAGETDLSTLETNPYIYNSSHTNVLIQKKNDNSNAIIQEIRFYYKPQGPRITSWETPDGTEFTVGDEITIPAPTATGDNVTFSYSCNTNDGISIDGNKATFSKAGKYTITATATDSGGTATATKVYNISDFQINKKPDSITEGAQINLSDFGTNVTDGVTWKVKLNSGEYVDFVDTYTVSETGTLTVQATRKGVTAEVEISVSAKDFSIKPEEVTLHKNGTQKLIITGLDSTDDITWTSSKESVATVADGVVTAVGEGETIITATRGDKSDTVKVNVADMKIKFDDKLATEFSCSLDINSSLKFEIVDAIGDVKIDEKNKDVAYIEGNYIKTTAKEKESATITFTDSAGASITVTVRIKEIKEVDVNVESYEKVTNVGTAGKITISKDKNWKATVSDLPTTDGKGHYYKYYIKEVKSDKYIPISYSNNGAELNNAEKHAVIELTNKPTGTSSVELPGVGGTGTLPYTATGLSFIATSAAIMFIRRRKRRSA